MGCVYSQMRVKNVAHAYTTNEKALEKHAEILPQEQVVQSHHLGNGIGVIGKDDGRSSKMDHNSNTGIFGTSDDKGQFGTSQKAMKRCTEILSLEHIEQPYHIFNQIGKGSFGKVYRGQKIGGDSMYAAVKKISPDVRLEKFYRSEMGTLMDLDHPNIVKFLDGYIYGGQLHIVMEYVAGMKLSMFRKRADCWGNRITGVNITGAIFRQCTSALEHIHRKNFIHGDVKNHNIMLDRLGCAKLIDFGFSTGTTTLNKPNAGTRKYMAPEVKSKRDEYGTSADIWSLGVTLMAFILDGTPSLLTDFPDVDAIWTRWAQDIPPVALPLLKSCLQIQPERRSTATELLQTELLKFHTYPPERLGGMVREAIAFS